MTILKALRKLFIAQGGNAADIKGQDIASAINNIADNGSVIYRIGFTFQGAILVADKTFKEIYDAIGDGKYAVGFLNMPNGTHASMPVLGAYTSTSSDDVEYTLHVLFGLADSPALLWPKGSADDYPTSMLD